MPDELLGAREVAGRLKLNYRTVINMTERGELPGFKVSNQWRYRASDIDAYIQAQIEKQKRERG